MPGCAAVGCFNSGEKGFSMKRFPVDPNRRHEWITQMNRDGWTPTVYSRICEAHFAPEMWEKVRVDGKKKLKMNAVPTLFPSARAKTIRKPAKSVRLTKRRRISDTGKTHEESFDSTNYESVINQSKRSGVNKKIKNECFSDIYNLHNNEVDEVATPEYVKFENDVKIDPFECIGSLDVIDESIRNSQINEDYLYSYGSGDLKIKIKVEANAGGIFQDIKYEEIHIKYEPVEEDSVSSPGHDEPTYNGEPNEFKESIVQQDLMCNMHDYSDIADHNYSLKTDTYTSTCDLSCQKLKVENV